MDFSVSSIFRALKPQQSIVWPNLIFMILLHTLAPYYLIFYSAQFKFYTWLWMLLCFSASIFGTTAGVHRLWAHRCYKVNTPLKIALLMCYAVSGQLSVRDWVLNHRVHHKHSDTDADPHNINRGFFFAHVGWLLQRKHPMVRSQQTKIDMSDITGDPYIAFHDRYFQLTRLLFAYLIPTYVPIIFWGESGFLAFAANVVRVFINLNMTWLVNSAAHTWGYRPYNKKIQSGEFNFINLFVFGEGWHNYHHQFPWDYKASELSHWVFNLTTMMLELFNKFGWVYDLKTASPSLVAKTIMKHGDGSHLISKIQPLSLDESKSETAKPHLMNLVPKNSVSDVPDRTKSIDIAEVSKTESRRRDHVEKLVSSPPPAYEQPPAVDRQVYAFEKEALHVIHYEPNELTSSYVRAAIIKGEVCTKLMDGLLDVSYELNHKQTKVS